MLWNEKSLGDCSPRVLSQTMWWILTQDFGLRGRQEHHSMEVEDFSFCVDDSGTEYATFKENPTKKRQKCQKCSLLAVRNVLLTC